MPGGLCTSDTECIGGFCRQAGGALCGVCERYVNGDGGVAGAACNRDRMCDPARTFCPGGDGTPSAGGCQAYVALDAGCNMLSTQQEECGPNRVCASPASFQAGRCIVGKLEGAVCGKGTSALSPLRECARSGRGVNELVCATVGANDTCVKSQNVAAGGTCGTGEGFGLGTFCLESEYCNANLCTARRASGQPCTNQVTDEECQAGLRCANGPGGVQCRPYLDLGTACNASGECKNYLTCTGNGQATCQPGFAADGGACGNAIGVQCAEGFCGADGGCQSLQGSGATCANANQCQSYTCSTTCQAACW
jgi:hypothetical protein